MIMLNLFLHCILPYLEEQELEEELELELEQDEEELELQLLLELELQLDELEHEEELEQEWCQPPCKILNAKKQQLVVIMTSLINDPLSKYQLTTIYEGKKNIFCAIVR